MATVKETSNLKGDIISIQFFKLTSDEIKEIYPRAYALPQFFLTNLVSQQRVVKNFSGKTALLQAFYYQLMKLVLQVEVEEIDYCKMVVEMFISYNYFEEGELQDEIFSDFQYRKFFKDFIELVDKQNIPSFQQKAEQYPIIDEILRKYFKLLVPFPLMQALEDPSIDPQTSARQLFTYLSQMFKIKFSEVGPCFKFEQSDTFIYFEQPQEVYLAYNDEFIVGQVTQDSDFKCGQGNSFLTKYHSLSEENSKSGKSFEKSKHWKQLSEEKTVIEQVDETQHLPLQNLRHISCQSQDSNRLELTGSKLAQSAVIKDFTNLFSPPLLASKPALPHGHLKALPQKENDQSLYSEFTSSFILRQLSPQNQVNINNIKQKYRNRQSIKGIY